MKKILTLLLCFILTFFMCSVALAADTDEELPTVYVIGAHKNEIYNAEGEPYIPSEQT